MALSDRTVTQAGFQLVIRSGSVSSKMRAEILEGLKEVGENYKRQVEKNVSLDDHTLAELRKMDYPYGVDKPENTPHDDRMIHEQSGEFAKSIKLSSPTEETSRRFSVFVTSDSPHAAHLIYGTATMRPRRFHEKAFQDIKDKYWDPVLSRLKKLNFRIGLR